MSHMTSCRDVSIEQRAAAFFVVFFLASVTVRSKAEFYMAHVDNSNVFTNFHIFITETRRLKFILKF